MNRIITLAALITVLLVPSLTSASTQRTGCTTHACKARVCWRAACKARVWARQHPRPVGYSRLQRIAQCESGGNPRAVSRNGLYRGKYQFDYGTWASVGGSGDPAAAPEAEQDRRAAMLLARRGTAPWPRCGRGV